MAVIPDNGFGDDSAFCKSLSSIIHVYGARHSF